MESFIATINMFAGNFAPRGWMLCQNQTLSIAQYTAVFSLVGTTYGGNGQTTFSLPDLRGRVPVGTGQGPGLQPYQLGQLSGVENTTLTQLNLPAHNHQAQATTLIRADQSGGNLSANPIGNWISVGQTGGSSPAPMKQFTTLPDPNPPTGTMAAGSAATTVTVGIAGSSQPFSILQPYLGMNYIFCMEGIFPPRN